MGWGAYSTSGDHHLPPPTKKPFLWVTTNEPEPYSSLPLCPLVIISCLSLFLSLFLSDLTKVIISCAGCVRYRQVSFFTGVPLSPAVQRWGVTGSMSWEGERCWTGRGSSSCAQRPLQKKEGCRKMESFFEEPPF